MAEVSNPAYLTLRRYRLQMQVWYIGPLGAKAGDKFGADLGFEVCLLITV